MSEEEDRKFLDEELARGHAAAEALVLHAKIMGVAWLSLPIEFEGRKWRVVAELQKTEASG